MPLQAIETTQSTPSPKRFDLEAYPIKPVLPRLLQDKTTRKNILWATNTYEALGAYYVADSQITEDLMSGINADIIQPRIAKAQQEQAQRTKKHAEVFTPSWLCCKMADALDEEWFSRQNVFFAQSGTSWQLIEGKIDFPPDKHKTWQKYVDTRVLEITCGEAPFLASRYDTVTGEPIPIERRIGVLDRKLRAVSENAQSEAEWLKWAHRALESVYGFEYQGDNLLIARINILLTFAEHLQAHLGRQATKSELCAAANIIAWNLWQMDGLNGTVPCKMPEDNYEQLSLLPQDEPQGSSSVCLATPPTHRRRSVLFTIGANAVLFSIRPLQERRMTL